MQPTEKFIQEIREIWGSPSEVAQKAFDELFRIEDVKISLDYDDQVKYALAIGLLAGETKDYTPVEFIKSFVRLFD